MPTITNPNPCVDHSSYMSCSYLSKKGYCVRNEKNCYKTCNCDLEMCVNNWDNCEVLTADPESCQDRDVQKNCYKSCFPEICDNSFFVTTPAPPPSSVCKDHWSVDYYCRKYSNEGKCLKEGYEEWMRHDCKASCGFC